MQQSVYIHEPRSETAVEFDSFTPHPPAAPQSVPQELQRQSESSARPLSVDTTAPQLRWAIDPPTAHNASLPLSARLGLHTDAPSEQTPAADHVVPVTGSSTAQSTGLPVRSSSVTSALSASRYAVTSRSPASERSSPGLGPVVDITPLPSPITPSWSPGRWRKIREREDCQHSRSEQMETAHQSSSADPVSLGHIAPRKLRAFTSQGEPSTEDAPAHDFNTSIQGRNRGFSDYLPEPLQGRRNQDVVVATSGPGRVEEQLKSPNQHLHREEYLAVKRGLAMPMPMPNLPTPPRSTRDADGSDSESILSSLEATGKKPIYEARSIRSGKVRRWRELCKLGEGTFSTVVLAVDEDGEDDNVPARWERVRHNPGEYHINPKSLVAVKICEHGPAGGADESRIGSSVTRELEILKAIDHPSLVRLKAVNILEHQTYMVLDYCAGGDLYELAFSRPDLLTPTFIQRVFAELVAAVRYLHSHYIVHRDVKLESAYIFSYSRVFGLRLVMLTVEQMFSSISRWSPSLAFLIGNVMNPRWLPSPI